jgi:hypothetical protein
MSEHDHQDEETILDESDRDHLAGIVAQALCIVNREEFDDIMARAWQKIEAMDGQAAAQATPGDAGDLERLQRLMED